MFKHKFTAVAVTFVLLVIGGAVMLWLFRGNLNSPPAKLPDGSVISFMGATYGTNHTAPGRMMDRWLSVLPAGLRSKLGVRAPGSYTTPNPQLMLWLDRRNTPTNSGYFECLLVDEHGDKSASSFTLFSAPKPGQQILGFSCPVFPRRSKSFKIRVYQQDGKSHGRTHVAEFTVRNPARMSYPEWKPEPLPQTRRDGDVEITLTRLITGVPSSGLIKPAPEPMQAYTRLYCRFIVAGQPSNDWRVEDIETSDATGNRIKSTSGSWQARDGENYLAYQWALWPSESAWKLRAELSRTADAHFAEDEICEIRGVKVPGDTNYTLINHEAELLGARVEVIGVAGKRAKLAGGNYFYSGQPRIEINVHNKPEGARLTLLKVFDDQGREVTAAGAGWSQTQYSLGLNIPKDAKTLDFKIALHHSRFVEFLVKPERPREAASDAD